MFVNETSQAIIVERKHAQKRYLWFQHVLVFVLSFIELLIKFRTLFKYLFCNLTIKMLNRFNVLSAHVNPNHVISTIEGIAGLGVIGISYQMQQIRTKSKIKFCGYLEPPEFKKRDIRYKTSTKHDPKRMTWQDYQV